MSNTRTYEELKQRLDAMADEMHGRKSEPNAAAKKQRKNVLLNRKSVNTDRKLLRFILKPQNFFMKQFSMKIKLLSLNAWLITFLLIMLRMAATRWHCMNRPKLMF